MNEQNRIELEKWELFKTPYSALCGIAESLYRLYSWGLPSTARRTSSLKTTARC